MTGRTSSERLLRRSRAIGWGTAAGASLATVGLVFGVTHTASTASTPTTSTSTNSSTNSGTSSTSGTTSKATVTTPQQNQAPVAASHGS